MEKVIFALIRVILLTVNTVKKFMVKAPKASMIISIVLLTLLSSSLTAKWATTGARMKGPELMEMQQRLYLARVGLSAKTLAEQGLKFKILDAEGQRINVYDAKGYLLGRYQYRFDQERLGNNGEVAQWGGVVYTSFDGRQSELFSNPKEEDFRLRDYVIEESILNLEKPKSKASPKKKTKKTGNAYVDYVYMYKELASDLYLNTKALWQIAVLQGILESRAGSSDLARETKNHFGIKCKGCTESAGTGVNKKDDDPADMFKVFPTIYAGWVHHRDLMHERRGALGSTGAYYTYLTRGKNPEDIVEWTVTIHENNKNPIYYNNKRVKKGQVVSGPLIHIQALQIRCAGYATSSHYADKLYNLYKDLKAKDPEVWK